MTPPDYEVQAREYATSQGDDCVSAVGHAECIYNFCGCAIRRAYEAGARLADAAAYRRGVEDAAKYVEKLRMCKRETSPDKRPPFDFDVIEMETAKRIARDIRALLGKEEAK